VSVPGRDDRRRLLLVEDDESLVLALRDRLRSEGFVVDVARDGDDGLELALEGDHELMILDVMLPGRGGFEVCRELRHRDVDLPVLMLTARGEVADTVVGLEMGADDYLTKPFEFIELLARIRALLRRARDRGAHDEQEYGFGPVRVDFRSAEVTRDGETVELSALELRLLKHFIDHRGTVLSRNELLDAVWGYDAMPSTRTVDVHVARLRRKIEPDPSEPRFLVTIRGLGYKFVG